MLFVLLRVLVGILGLAVCTTATCGPARADALDIAMRSLCGKRGPRVVPLIRASSARFGVDPLLVGALIAAESRCRPHVVGARGEIGLGQIHPRGSAAVGFSLAMLHTPAGNVDATAKHLARCLALCGFAGGALSVYSGRRYCRESPYSRRVLGMLPTESLEGDG
jgi:hypothetical protein